jgi:glycine/D-amino acid oxidase-like deaminating enzyme
LQSKPDPDVCGHCGCGRNQHLYPVNGIVCHGNAMADAAARAAHALIAEAVEAWAYGEWGPNPPPHGEALLAIVRKGELPDS